MLLSSMRSPIWSGAVRSVLLLIVSYLIVLGSVYLHFRGDDNGDSGPFIFAVVTIAGMGTLFMILASLFSTYLSVNFSESAFVRCGAIVLLSLVAGVCLCATYAWSQCVYDGWVLFTPAAVSYALLAIIFLKQVAHNFR